MKVFEMIKKNLIVNAGDILGFALFPMGGGLFGIILSTIIYFISGREYYMEMASLMCLIMGAFTLFLASAFAERTSFTNAITLGVTRGNYIIARYIVLFIEAILSIALMILMILVDKMLFPSAVHQSIIELSSINFLGVFALCLLVPVLSMFFGMLYVKFEKKFFWFMWALWMIGCIGGPRIGSAMSDHPESVIAKIGFFFVAVFSLPTWSLILLLAVILGVIIFITNRMYKTLTLTV